jgi:hypothetical protein
MNALVKKILKGTVTMAAGVACILLGDKAQETMADMLRKKSDNTEDEDFEEVVVEDESDEEEEEES